MENIIKYVAKACHCDEKTAEEYVESEVQNLQDLADVNDLRSSDFRVACESLGIEYDYVEYFVERMANYAPKAKEDMDDDEVTEDDDEFSVFGDNAIGLPRVTLEMLCAV